MEESTPTQREDRSTSFTLSVTLILMCVLVVVAWLLKREATGRERVLLDTPGTVQGASTTLGPDGAPRIPVNEKGKPLSEYQVLTNCHLEQDPANGSDVFKVSHPQGTHRFSLYWVNGVKTNGATPEATRQFSDHFDLHAEERLREIGAEASSFSQNLLRHRPFRIVTKWENDPERDAIYCFAYLNDGQGALQNLALMLVHNGLALIHPSSRELPEEKISAGDFHNLLNAAEEEARKAGSGAWAREGQ